MMVILQNAHKDRVMGFKTKAVWFWVIWGHPLFWETPTLRIIIPLGGEQVGLVFSVWRGTSQDGLANVNGFPPGILFGRRYERGFKKLACHSWRVWVDPHSWLFFNIWNNDFGLRFILQRVLSLETNIAQTHHDMATNNSDNDNC